jgi:hypothetical protein
VSALQGSFGCRALRPRSFRLTLGSLRFPFGVAQRTARVRRSLLRFVMKSAIGVRAGSRLRSMTRPEVRERRPQQTSTSPCRLVMRRYAGSKSKIRMTARVVPLLAAPSMVPLSHVQT